MRIGPVGFLFLVVGGWAAVRAVMLWPEHRTIAKHRRIAWQAPWSTEPRDAFPLPLAAHAAAVIVQRKPAPARNVAPAKASPPSNVLLVAAEPAPERPGGMAVALIQPPQPPAPAAMPRDRLSVSAWSIVRGRTGPGLASAGQLGGSQAGLRARYDLGSGFAAAVRVSGPLRTRLGKEAAVALDWRPLSRVPVTLTVERRVGLDRGGRDAFALGVFGGVDSVPLPFRVVLDGYAQAGLVGARRRDPYVDGAFRLERKVFGAGKVKVGAGAGLWGGAQPGVSRLDVGPQLVAHVPIGKGAVRIGGEWRERVAGHARPGSGFALSVGADF